VIRGALRQTLQWLATDEHARRCGERIPVPPGLLARFLGGPDPRSAAVTAAGVLATGRHVTVAALAGPALSPAQASETRDAYLAVLRALAEAELTEHGRAEVSVSLPSLGQGLGRDGERLALDHAREICRAAATVGTTVTLDMEDHTTTDPTLEALRELRRDFPWVGVVLQAQLRRTEEDARDLAYPGSRVRLCKGSPVEPASVAYRDPTEVSRSFVRCLRLLLAGPGQPLIATHDQVLLDIAGALAVRNHRPQGSYEYQMLQGIRVQEQERLIEQGEAVRVYLPFGREWYGYLLYRLAERPRTAGLLLRSVLARP